MKSTKTLVSIFLPSLRGGGAERVMLTLANGIADYGFKVDLVLAKAEGPYLNEVSSKVRIVDLKSKRISTSLPSLVRYLRKSQPEVLLSALSHANLIALIARTLSLTLTKVFVSEHANFSLSQKNSLSLKSKFMRPLMRWIYPFADGVISVSRGVSDDIKNVLKLHQERCHVIYNPIVTDEIENQCLEYLNHSWFTPNSAPVILGVGRLTPQKDFSTLIRAFAKVRSSRECRLVILGEGPLKDELSELVRSLGITDDVEFPGFVRNPFTWMKSSSLFVLSSAWEGFGNVLVESMACGTPVISTDCPSGPAEILENGKWGKLIPVANVDALATAISESLSTSSHPEILKRANEFGATKAVENYLAVMGLK